MSGGGIERRAVVGQGKSLQSFLMDNFDYFKQGMIAACTAYRVKMEVAFYGQVDSFRGYFFMYEFIWLDFLKDV